MHQEGLAALANNIIKALILQLIHTSLLYFRRFKESMGAQEVEPVLSSFVAEYSVIDYWVKMESCLH